MISRALPLPFGRAGWIGPALILSALVALFWPGLVALVIAWSEPDYSHGPLIPLVTLVLVLRRLGQTTAPLPDRVTPWPGMSLLSLALILLMAGHLTRTPDLVALALVPWTFALLLTLLGGSEGGRHWPALLHLCLMLPLPGFLYWKLSLALQSLSAEAGVAMLRALGIAVHLDGTIIDLGITRLGVAEACSGLRYLMPTLSFAWCLAALWPLAAWARVALVLAAIPLAVAMNALRLAMIGALAGPDGGPLARGAAHAGQGFVLFALCLLLLWLLSRALHGEGPSAGLDGPTLQRGAARLAAAARGPGLALALGLTGATGLVLMLLPALPPAEVLPRETFATFPRELGDWTGEHRRLTPEIEAVLGASDYLEARFLAPDAAAPVTLFAAFHADQRPGQAIHSPEICLPAGGWEIESLSQRPGGSGLPALSQAVIRRGGDRQLVWFWYEQGGVARAGGLGLRLQGLLTRVLQGRADGAVVRLTTPLAPGESQAAAEARLQGFLMLAAGPLRRHLPGP